MGSITSHRDLEVWRAAIGLVETCYRTTATFPSDERFGLTAQMREAAVSIVANIAEGHGRRTRGAYLHHVRIAAGSLAELDTHVELARRLQMTTDDGWNPMIAELTRVGRMLSGLIRALERPRATTAEG